MCSLVSYILPPRVNKDEANKRICKKNKMQFEKELQQFYSYFSTVVQNKGMQH